MIFRFIARIITQEGDIIHLINVFDVAAEGFSIARDLAQDHAKESWGYLEGDGGVLDIAFRGRSDNEPYKSLIA